MPQFRYNNIVKKLKKAGFVFLRQAKGAHELWQNPESGNIVLISNHASKAVSTGTLNNIIKRAGFKNIEEFQKF